MAEDPHVSSKEKSRPILFSAPMVNAILEGRKTQTRRAIKHVTPGVRSIYRPFRHEPNNWQGIDGRDLIAWYGSCRYGIEGQSLWVRETWAQRGQTQAAIYKADEKRALGAYGAVRWTPSIHMPRWASRITLQIVEIRVERLQDISQADCIAEGMPQQTGPFVHHVVADYRRLWGEINGKDAWDKNPWVWVVEFRPESLAMRNVA